MDPYSQQPQKNIKGLIVFISIIAAIILAVLWVYNHAFIQVSVPGVGDEKLSYKLINQKTGNVTNIESSSGSIKKLVQKGRYEVLVSGQEKSHYLLANTGSFLSTSKVEAKLEPEKARTFIGNNPDPCMYFDQNILFSYSCGGTYGDLKIHSPASASTPTFTETANNALIDLPLGGLAKISGQDTVLLGGQADAEPELRTSRLIDLKADFNPTISNKLSDLGTEKFFEAIEYQNGLLAYASGFDQIFHYENPSSTPKKIEIPKPEDNNLSAVSLDALGSRIVVVYSDKVETADAHEQSSNKGKTSVQLYESGKTKSFEFKSHYNQARLCGDKHLCQLVDKQVVVFDISGDKAIEQFRINGAETIDSDQNTLLVVKEEGVLAIDVTKRTGSFHYTLGGYKVCGSKSVNTGGYALCVISPKNTKSALYINSKQNNSDSIDKKILPLLSQSYISDVSIYKSFIYISPELGEPEYNAAINGYVSNPAVRQRVGNDIEKLINESGIDRSHYTVINTQP